MSLLKPEELSYSQNVLQHRGQYYAIISAAVAFDLAEPDALLPEAHILKALPETEAGFAKLKAEILVISEHVQPPIPPTDHARWQYFKADKTYWQTQGFPILPDDFDFRFFQEAPLPQQFKRDFQPGKSYKLTLQSQKLKGSLPFLVALETAQNKGYDAPQII